MKKTIILLFLILNALLFLGIMAVYKENDFAYIHQIEIQQSNSIMEFIAFENTKDEFDYQVMFDVLKELARKFDVLISVSLSTHEINQYDFYMLSNENIDARLGLVTDASVNFAEISTQYYTNNADDSEGIYFYLLNQDLKVNIYPLSQLEAMPNTVIRFSANSQQILDNSIEILLEKFGDNLTRHGPASSTPFIVQDEINNFLPMTIILAITCISLLLMMYVQTQSKKIAIFKTMGMSTLRIGIKIFSSLFLTVLVAVILENILLFVFYVNAINMRTIPIVLDIFRLTIYQMAGMLVIIGLGCLLLTFVPTYSLLKNSRLTHYIMNVNFAIKVAVLLVILPIVSVNIDTLWNSFLLMHYRNNPAVAQYQFVPRYKTQFEIDGYDLRTYMTEFDVSKDPNIIYSYDILYEYQRAYQILNDADAILCVKGQPYPGVTEITVNENYLKKYPITSVDGQVIDIDTMDADIIYFIPEYYYSSGSSYADLDNSRGMGDENYEVVKISNKQNIYIFDAWNYESLQKPCAIVLYKNNTFRLETSIFWSVYSEHDINELLKDTWFYNKIVVSTVGKSAAYSRQLLMNSLKYDLLLIVLSLVLILMLIVQNAYLYGKVYASRIFARKIMGHNPFLISGKLIIESGSAVVLAFIVYMIKKADVRLLLIVAGIEMLVYLVTVLASWKIKVKFSNSIES